MLEMLHTYNLGYLHAFRKAKVRYNSFAGALRVFLCRGRISPYTFGVLWLKKWDSVINKVVWVIRTINLEDSFVLSSVLL